MKSVPLVRALAAVACAALVVALWTYGASICNEACTPARALSLQVLSLALPASVLLAVFTSSPASSAWTRRASRVLLAVLLLWAAYACLAR